MNTFFLEKKENQKSVRTIKLCSALCLGLGLIIVSCFASFYWELYERTVFYDDGLNLPTGDAGVSDPDDTAPTTLIVMQSND